MKKHCSIKYLILHLLCYLLGAGVIYSAYNVYSYLNNYDNSDSSYINTYDFHKSYMKYIERLTFFVHYSDSGYTVNLSSPADLEEILRTEDNNHISNPMNTDVNEQENFEFYNYCLNIQNTNFLYYVENTTTGQVYYSPYLDKLYPDSVETFTKNIEDNPAYFILNTKTGKYTTNVSQNYDILTKSDLTWIISTLSTQEITEEKEDPEEFSYLIYTGIVPDFSNKSDIFYNDHSRFESLSSRYHSSLYLLPIFCVLGLLSLLFLILETGHHMTNGADTGYVNGIYLSGFDRIPTEIGAFLILALFFGELLLLRELIYSIFLGTFPVLVIAVLIYLIVYPVCISGILSLTRRIKAKTLFRHSVCYVFGHHLYIKTKAFFKHHGITYHVAAFLIFFLTIQGVGALLYLYTHNKILLIGVIGISYLYLITILMRTAIDLGVIMEAAKLMQEGDMNLKIPAETLSAPVSELGDYINNISAGLSVAVDERTKSERFKAELITNVSHDIKTPLTSIINYVDLLKKEPFDNPKAREYLEILTNKSWRLKTLIEDLVEASKASSGAIKMQLQKLNLVELVKQAAGEFDDRFHDKELEIVITAPLQPVSIFADGRSTYRVIDNLFSNVNKYAMHGTRVYVDVTTEHGYGILSVKNISRDKLNITAAELMERFVRGDVSRNTEGSGLGLSISRSLTTLQHGAFDLEVDGDLFKAIVSLPLAIDPME